MGHHRYRQLSIIIPCFNEAQTLLEVLYKIAEVDLGTIAKEIIIVDDGSDQKTKAVLKSLEDICQVIYLPKNIGKGYAIRQGLKEASGDIIIIQDGDLEYNPRDYPLLIKPLLLGEAQAVYGSRFLKPGNKRSKYYWGVKLLTWLTNFLYHAHISDEATCYKVFNAKLLKSIPLSCRGFEFCPEVTAKILRRKIPIKEVPVSYKPRTVEQGKKVRIKDGIIAAWTLLKYKFLD